MKSTTNIKEEELGKDPEADLALLLSECKKSLSKVDEDLITRAFNFVWKFIRMTKELMGDLIIRTFWQLH